jgi:hypothetical protein
MAEKENQYLKGSIMTRHWIVQRSLIDVSYGNVSLKVFTWGQGESKVPEGDANLPEGHFAMNFYGYVAGKA